MVYKVLVVDDSSFFQVRLKAMINEHPQLSVVGVAANGNEAIALADELKPDIISMDYEMPYLDGVSAVRAILAKRWVPIVMFSSLTYEGARITLDALAAGAVDFIPKNFAEVSRNSTQVKKTLHDTLLTFVRKAQPVPPSPSPIEPATEQSIPHRHASATPLSPAQPSVAPRPRKLKHSTKLVVIGASTGGPVAVTEVLQKLPVDFPVPVVIVQHMPPNFTQALADRLHRQCPLAVSEARDGDLLRPGQVYIAPGGQQLMFVRQGIKILPGDERVNYRPSVDIAFASAANTYGAAVLAVVLTGMGADGCEGARVLKQKGATVWSQDQASCVVYGMPKAVATAQLTDLVLPLGEIGLRLVEDL